MDDPSVSHQKLVDFYSQYDEQGRLAGSLGQVEFLRSQAIIQRFLPHPPALMMDVGGAAGRYSCWLARQGYQVHLVDPVLIHVQQAQAASNAQPETPIASCTVGDARYLQWGDSSVDAVLLMGPLYHLTEAGDRKLALSEARRVLKTGGLVFAAGISRFASTIDGLTSGDFLDPAFREIMRTDLEAGQHRNPTRHPRYFMDTFFHHPNELEAEITGAGFEILGLFAIEGISYLMQNFNQNWAVESRREFLLEILSKTEQEPSLMGASPHLMCVGRKK
jgi:ubiquinone/menaquinone biosynthesis C-methylase UbiE